MKQFSNLVIGVIAFAVAGCEGSTVGFDRAKWDVGKGIFAEDSPRLKMVDAAMAAGVKVGATRSAVLQIIGEPDLINGSDSKWFLGLNGMVPDPLTLVVTFGANGFVTKTNIQRT
jgi:outer membrane protein assembly factor BamE (lipoprotein component of BamABCDE complex)